jgi:amidase
MTPATARVPFSKETCAFFLDTEHLPSLTVQVGQQVEFEAMNAFSEETETEEELNAVIDRGYHHPFTGPVYVDGVRPGDTLKVRLQSIVLHENIYSCISRSSGVLRGRFPFRNYKKLRLDGNKIDYEGIELDSVPSLGGAGVADPEGTRNGATGKHGGNFDFRFVTSGSTLYLPVAVPGGLFYLGDLHALHANGEVSGVSFEASGRVTAQFDALPVSIDGPLIHTPVGTLVVGYGETFDAAVVMATERTVALFAGHFGLREADAYQLAGTTCDVVIGHLTGRIKSVALHFNDDLLSPEVYLRKKSARGAG